MGAARPSTTDTASQCINADTTEATATFRTIVYSQEISPRFSTESPTPPPHRRLLLTLSRTQVPSTRDSLLICKHKTKRNCYQFYSCCSRLPDGKCQFLPVAFPTSQIQLWCWQCAPYKCLYYYYYYYYFWPTSTKPVLKTLNIWNNGLQPAGWWWTCFEMRPHSPSVVPRTAARTGSWTPWHSL